MIKNDEQLKTAQGNIIKLEDVLLAARKTHPQNEYALMSSPILLEIQERQNEIVQYLSSKEGATAITV